MGLDHVLNHEFDLRTAQPANSNQVLRALISKSSPRKVFSYYPDHGMFFKSVAWCNKEVKWCGIAAATLYKSFTTQQCMDHIHRPVSPTIESSLVCSHQTIRLDEPSATPIQICSFTRTDFERDNKTQPRHRQDTTKTQPTHN